MLPLPYLACRDELCAFPQTMSQKNKTTTKPTSSPELLCDVFGYSSKKGKEFKFTTAVSACDHTETEF